MLSAEAQSFLRFNQAGQHPLDFVDSGLQSLELFSVKNASPSKQNVVFKLVATRARYRGIGNSGFARDRILLQCLPEWRAALDLADQPKTSCLGKTP